jgi:amino acid transporter
LKLPPSSPFNPQLDQQQIELPRARRLGLFALVCVIYFTVSGGAFGIEPLVGAVGPGLALLLIVVTPFVWSVPMSLMVAELATLIPEEGGYYVWVKESLGEFWAVQDAWWTMAYSIALMAMLPLLFVTYLDFFLRLVGSGVDLAYAGLGPHARWLLTVAIIVTATIVNLFGARDVGRSSKISAVLVVGSFAALVLLWVLRHAEPSNVISIVKQDLASNRTHGLLLGLLYIVLNYSGWDNVSTYAAEVDCPQRNYPRAIAVALIVVILGYLLPVIAGISVTTDRALWTTDAGWPVIAQLIGGRWLGSLIAVAGLVSVWALVNAQLFYVSRMPLVLARDCWLPPALARVASDSAAPRTAVVCCAAIAAVLAAFSFGGLAVIQCLLYAGALTLEFLALIILRLPRPQAHRPFRVPEECWGLGYVCLAPFVFAGLVSFATLQDWRSFPGQMLVVGFVVLSGATLYFVRSRKSVLSPVQNAGTEIQCVTDSPPPDEEGVAWRYLRRERLDGGGQWRNN